MMLDGKPTVCGGCAHHCTTISKECYQLDNTCQWKPFTNITIERGGHAVASNKNGEVSLFSGLGIIVSFLPEQYISLIVFYCRKEWQLKNWRKMVKIRKQMDPS